MTLTTWCQQTAHAVCDPADMNETSLEQGHKGRTRRVDGE